MDIDVGTHWECTRDYDGIEAGSIATITDLSESEVEFSIGGCRYKDNRDSFLAVFRYAENYDPDEMITSKIKGLLEEFNSIDRAQESLASEIQRAETTAVTVSDSASTKKELMKRAKKDIKQLVTRADTIRNELQQVIEEKQELIRSKMEVLNKTVSFMEEGIWSINLYMGVGEEIIQLAEGEPAPQDTKVCIRQQLLFMDEEAAVDLHEGKHAFDADDVGEFDEWIKEPRHLQQVLPEPKGVVALRVRRTKLDYGDRFVNMIKNKENMRTYFLVRNGENLYRIYADIMVGRMFPLSEEFDEFFFASDWRGDRKTPIRPGTIEYNRALEKADSKKRHYLRVLLILQGLFDRTKVFDPYEGPRVNLGDPREYDHVLQFIRDDELTLPSGRPSWDEWLQQVNEHLNVGCRIVGNFSGLGREDCQDEGRMVSNNRWISMPDNNQIYTLEKRSTVDGRVGYRFYYEDTTMYGNNKRFGFTVFQTDDFVINIDGANVKDLLYYLHARTERQNYFTMVPLIKTAIKMKQEEAEQEKPFISMLSGELMKIHDRRDIEDMARDLSEWWKYKNQTHRALLSDDTKALNEIKKEYEIRLQREAERTHLDADINEMKRVVLDSEDDVVYIGHKKERLYAVYTACNDENIYVNEQTWRMYEDGPRKVKTVPWKVVDKRYLRWQEIYSDDRWESWCVGVSRLHKPSDPEINGIIEAGFQKLRDIQADSRGTIHTRYQIMRPLAAAWQDGDLRLYAQSEEFSIKKHSGTFIDPTVRDGHWLIDTLKRPAVRRVKVSWKMNGHGHIEFDKFTSDNQVCSGFFPDDRYFATYGKRKQRICWDNADKIYYKSEENIKILESQVQEYLDINKMVNDVEHTVQCAIDKLWATWEDIEKRRQFEEFIKDNDPDEWPAREKDIRLHRGWTHELRGLVEEHLSTHMPTPAREIPNDCINIRVRDIISKSGQGEDHAVPEDLLDHTLVLDQSVQEEEDECR